MLLLAGPPTLRGIGGKLLMLPVPLSPLTRCLSGVFVLQDHRRWGHLVCFFQSLAFKGSGLCWDLQVPWQYKQHHKTVDPGSQTEEENHLPRSWFGYSSLHLVTQVPPFFFGHRKKENKKSIIIFKTHTRQHRYWCRTPTFYSPNSQALLAHMGHLLQRFCSLAV